MKPRKVSRLLFGNRNNHSLKQVCLWRMWRIYTRYSYKKRLEIIPQNLLEKGVEILGRSNVDELAELVTTLLSEVPVQKGFCSLPRQLNVAVAPLIFRILEEHSAKIKSYFRSNFRVNWFEVQRIEEGLHDPGGSFDYHTDDVPDDVVKLFIYLTDCTESTGAFRTFDYQVTDDLIRQGMLTSASPGQARANAQQLISKDLEKNLMVIEGRKGTVFIFDNNLIHKGTLPRYGQRISVSMELMPAVEELNIDDFSKNCALPIKEYFPRNPFYLLWG